MSSSPSLPYDTAAAAAGWRRVGPTRAAYVETSGPGPAFRKAPRPPAALHWRGHRQPGG